MKVCPRCGYENPDNTEFCLKCYYPLFVQSVPSNKTNTNNKKICPRCGHENPPDALFCEKCHYPLFQIRETSIEEPVMEKLKKEELKITVFNYLLISSIFYIISMLGFSFFPHYMSIVNLISTIFLSLSIHDSKVKWYYYLVNLSPLGIFLLSINPMVGYFIFSLGGVIISDYIRVLYVLEKDEIFRIAGLILIIGYIGGLLFIILYDMIIPGFLVLIMESIRRIREGKKKKEISLPS
ncbi:zinc ribbon domain-containing protein [Sulfurisphaera javensis]|uniref:Zinc ribbon domain-containing protein n=1 Tax=Sulfurisphaera javensis TaxID=2049879 RepID=A0AAT9GN79_9CREN